ncbi:hypothetical protein ABH922_005557 [Rhodococcus sp. 27YEA15]
MSVPDTVLVAGQPLCALDAPFEDARCSVDEIYRDGSSGVTC